jgi:hypothetical protein
VDIRSEAWLNLFLEYINGNYLLCVQFETKKKSLDLTQSLFQKSGAICQIPEAGSRREGGNIRW